MNTEMLGTLGMIGFLTVWIVAGYISLRRACRNSKPAPDWFEGWDQ